MRYEIALLVIAAGLVVLATGCSNRSANDTTGGGGDVRPSHPPPVVQINPWTPPGPNDPIVLSVTITNTGSYVYLPGTAPNQTRVVVKGSASMEPVTVDVNPSNWSDGVHTIELTDVKDRLKGSKTLTFDLFVNCQSGTGPVVVIIDKEP